MIHPALIHPNSIVVVGGSDNPHSPGGKIVDNLLTHHYAGGLYIVNPKKENIKNLPTYKQVSDLPNNVELAIIAIAASYVEETVKILTEQKNTKAFIIISAGFSDAGEQGKNLEEKIVKQISKYGGSLLGPNNIGLINQNYAGVFTTPVPSLSPEGVDLISGSGATAVFIMEAAMTLGLKFNSIWSVGNSAQIGIEEVLAYMDENYTEDSPKIKLLYIESIKKPKKLLNHAQSLKSKGCHIIGIKAGSSRAGSRAASSHTGALANSDMAVKALFEKAGIIRVYGREEMIYTAAILQYGLPQGKQMAIVTHAGGPGVMLTDVLEKNALKVPELKGLKAEELKKKLYPGASIANPIDFLATGTAEHLNSILTSLEQDFDQIDATAVIFGSPGLFKVYKVYDVLAKHIQQNKKPVYPILPSVINVADEIKYFHQKGYPSFADEVVFGQALTNIMKQTYSTISIDKKKSGKIKRPIEFPQNNTYLPPELGQKLLTKFGFPLTPEKIFTDKNEALNFAKKHFPVVLKVVGPLHKTEVNGVRLNIDSEEDFDKHYEDLKQIPGCKGIMVQAQKKGIELFAGIKKEAGFGHLILFGFGGIYIETLKDFKSILAPATKTEIKQKIKQLQLYPLLKGIRGQKGINIEKFVNLIEKLSLLAMAYPEIEELDFNPILAEGDDIFIVDARIKTG